MNAIRHGERIVVAQAGGSNVVNAEDTTEVVVDGLIVPLGLASDGTNLYVGDWATGNIWVVDDAGSGVLAEGLAQPEGLALDGDRLLVVETGAQQVTAVDLATGATSPVITGLAYSAVAPEGFLPMGMLAGVAVGPDGAIYVSDDGVNSVYRFERPSMSPATAAPASQGKMTAQCVFGAADPNPQNGRIRGSQDCVMSSEGVLPIDADQRLVIEFLNSEPSGTFGDPIIGFGETAHVYGGYVSSGADGRFVSSVLGVDGYAGEVIHIVGHSPGDGNVAFDWYVGDGPQPFGATGDFEETIEIRIECSPIEIPADADDDVTAAETCTYSSDDSRIALAPTTDVIRTVGVDDVGMATGSVSYYTATTDSGVVRGGLVDENGVRRWAGGRRSGRVSRPGA